jgi:hypothetical protein
MCVAFALYCWNKFTDFVVTLRRSEFGNRLAADDVAEAEQARMNKEFVAEQTVEASGKSLTWAKRRAAEYDLTDPSTAVGVSSR